MQNVHTPSRRFQIEKLEDRIAPGIGNGIISSGLVNVSANVNVPIHVDVENNDVCVAVAAVNSAAGCDQ